MVSQRHLVSKTQKFNQKFFEFSFPSPIREINAGGIFYGNIFN